MAEKNNNPYNLEAEQTLLGCILIDSEIQLDVVTALKPTDFYVEVHRLIFEAMNDIILSNRPIDQITLVDTLEKRGNISRIGGIGYITGLIRGVPSSSNYKYYLDIVKRDGLLRKLIKAGTDILTDAATSEDGAKSLQLAEENIFKISDENDAHSLENLSLSYGGVLETLEKIAEDKDYLKGLMTGYTKLDNLLNGFKPGNLIILAARPAVGKTTLAMNIVTNIAMRHNTTCAVFSLEMSKEELAQRMLFSMASTSLDRGIKGKLEVDDWDKLNKAQQKLNDLKIFVDDTAMTTVPQMLSKCRRIKARHGLGLIVVDHIQLVRSAKNYDSRHTEVSDISRDLKMLAKEMGVPVLVLSQLRREVTGRKGGVPMLSDLKESGSIEQDADAVLLIHRPDQYATEKEITSGQVKKNVAEIRVEKNRSGATGICQLLFKGECTKFINPPADYHNDDTAPAERKKPSIVEEDIPLPEAPPEEDDDFPFDLED